jgi:hypothetical protein
MDVTALKFGLINSAKESPALHRAGLFFAVEKLLIK